MARDDLIQLRRGTAAAWEAANPVLASGEQGYETDTRRLKIGDGTTAYNDLPYSVGGPIDVVLTEDGVGLSVTLADDQTEDALRIRRSDGLLLAHVDRYGGFFVDTVAAIQITAEEFDGDLYGHLFEQTGPSTFTALPALLAEKQDGLQSQWHTAGVWHAIHGQIASSANTWGVAGVLDLAPFYYDEAFTFDQLAVEVTAGVAASSVRLAVYDRDAGADSFTKVLDLGTWDTSAIAVLTQSLAGTLTRGWHYFGAAPQGGVATMRCTQSANYTLVSPLPYPGAASAAAVGATGINTLTKTVADGALPATVTPDGYGPATARLAKPRLLARRA